MAFVMTSITAFSQNPFVGIWEGKVNMGMELRVIFTLKEGENKELTAAMDLPDNGMKGK